MSEAALAPELEATIDSAIAELDRSVMEAKLNDDPLRHPLSALSSFLKAQRRLYANHTLTLREEIEAARRPMRDDELRNAIIMGISAHASGVVRALNWRNLIMGLAGLVVFGAACAVGGYLWHGNQQLIAGVSNGRQECHDTPGGGSLCYIPVWAKLPAAAAN